MRDSAGRWGLTWRVADDGLAAAGPVRRAGSHRPSGPQASAVRLAGVRLRTGQIVDPYFAQFVPQARRRALARPALTAPAARVAGPDALRRRQC